MKSLDTIIRNARKTDKDKLVIVKLSELEKYRNAWVSATDLSHNLKPFFERFKARVSELHHQGRKDRTKRMELDYAVFTIELDLKQMSFLDDCIEGIEEYEK